MKYDNTKLSRFYLTNIITADNCKSKNRDIVEQAADVLDLTEEDKQENCQLYIIIVQCEQEHILKKLVCLIIQNVEL